jgi:hypothetical protein
MTIPAALYNRCRLLLTRSELPQLFVPLRSMQFMAVINHREIIFIDYQGGYMVQDGEGGRLITLAWQFATDEPRASLNQPVKMELVHYRQDVRALHLRIMSEFPSELEQFSEKASEDREEPREQRILPFRPRSD